MPVAFDSNQFKNWLPPYGFAVQNRQSSPVAPPSVTATFWVALFVGADQDSNPFQCQMPVAFGRDCLKTIFQNRSRQPLFLAHSKEKATNYTPKTVHKTRGGRFCLSKSVLLFSFVRYAAPGTNRWFRNRPVCILWCSFRL